MKRYILSVILFLIFNTAFAQMKYSRAKIHFDGKSGMELTRAGIDLTEGVYKTNTFFISDFSEKELARIRLAGYRVEIQIDDVQKFYRERNSKVENNSQRTSSAVTCGQTAPEYATPSHFYLGGMGGFFTYSQMLNILDSMTLLYPNLITAKAEIDPTYSIEGNPIYFVKISDNPNANETEPEVLYTAVHHAREPESMSQLIFYMWYLLENYSSDTAVKNLVDNTQMYFVTCLNPDGYMYNEMTDPFGGGMWRKNRRDNLDGEWGVDLNRNYDYQWGYDDNGSSPSTIAETYHGTFPFSEPETQAISNFVNAHEFKLTLNYHTYGNHLINPWGFVPDTLTPDSVIFDTYSGAISRENHYHTGTTNQTLNYLVNGDSDDWFYGEQSTKPKIFAWTPEVGTGMDGFWPQSDRIIPLSLDNMHANFTMARLAGRYGELHHTEDRYVTLTISQCGFDFQLLGLDTTGNYTVSITPLSPSILSVGAARVYTGMSLLQIAHDSIAIDLIPTIEGGDAIDYILNLDNGLFVLRDTIHQIFGSPVVAVNDSANDMSNWNVSTTCKWEIEQNFDYVQVQASTDNGNTWTSLCGKYTIFGAQAFGEPLYDGIQPTWVNEEVSLNDFFGQTILLRFIMVSDNGVELDGFYFDDLKVVSVASTAGIPTVQANIQFVSAPFPNPTHDGAKVTYANLPAGSVFVLYNSLGEQIVKQVLTEASGEINISTAELAAGVYSYVIRTAAGLNIGNRKLVVR
ncbi:MAG: immune inhibitor A [Bacteroidetes bacterium]|nr:immune inhibitor A [Bacteroidota bacterium]